MPFVKRPVEPKFLSRKPLNNKTQDELQEAVANTTLAAALRQLACVAACADEIFRDLTAQVTVVGERAAKLEPRIVRLDEIVLELNAKEVPVPAGTLDQFSRLKEHYASPAITPDRRLFTTDSRPAFVARLYEAAVASPVRIIRQIDQFRGDGCRSSKYFLCLPFFKDGKVNFDVEIEMRKPASLSGARDWLSNDDTLDSIVGPVLPGLLSSSGGDADASDGSAATPTPDDDSGFEQLLPTPEEKTYVMSLKYPYSDVPIDVTGTGFKRMLTLRRSFIQQMENFAKRKKRDKRHNTVNGQSRSEIVAALKAGSSRPLKKSSTGTQTSCPKLNQERSASAASTSSDTSAGNGRRTCSSDPAGSRERIGSPNSKGANVSVSSGSNLSDAGHKESSTGSSNVFNKWFQRRGRNRSSIIGGIGVCEELDRVKKSRRSLLGQLLSLSSPATAVDASPSKSSTDSAVATSSTDSGGRQFRSLRRPKQLNHYQHHRSSLPVSSTGTAAAVVRMRESSARVGKKGGGEDGGQSSSGNWSASSSTRTSMESSEEPAPAAPSASTSASAASTPSPDHLIHRSGSPASLSKDSALSDRTTPNEELRWHESSNGYHSDSTYSSSQRASQRWTKRSIKSDTARWLRSLEEEAGAGGGATASATSSTGTITPRVHRRHRARSPPDGAAGFVLDDGESSEFSVDCDGYYTSMHTDSGLRTLPIAPAPGHHLRKNGSGHHDDHAMALGKFSRLSDLLEHGSTSTVSSDADDTLASVATLPTPDDRKRKVPPPPPPRRSTLGAVSTVAVVHQTPKESQNGSRQPSPVSDSSVSDAGSSETSGKSAAPPSDDSEAEHGAECFRRKTSMGPGRIPSLCVVTPSASDDEEEPLQPTAVPNVEPPTWTSNPTAYTSLPRHTDLQKRSWLHDGWTSATPSADSSTLPRSFERHASFGAGPSTQPSNTNSWPRRPLSAAPTYRPTVVKLSPTSAAPPSGAMTDGVTRDDSPVSCATPMASFSQPPIAGAVESRSEVVVAKQPSIRRPYPPVNEGAPRQGARVTLDAAGRPVVRGSNDVVRPPLITAQTSLTRAISNQSPVVGAPLLSPTSSRPELIRPSHIPVIRSVTPVHVTPEAAQPGGGQSNCNTFPRWKPLQSSTDRNCSSAQAGERRGVGAPGHDFPSGSLPRRWNNFSFLRKDNTGAAGSLTSGTLTHSPSPPDSLASAKTGAYVRLDGHPTHLEPLTQQSPPSCASSSTSVEEMTTPAMPLLQQQYLSGSRMQATPSPTAFNLLNQSPVVSTTAGSASPAFNRPAVNSLPPYYRPIESPGPAAKLSPSNPTTSTDYARLRTVARQSAYSMPATGSLSYGRVPPSVSQTPPASATSPGSRIPVASPPTYVGPPQYRQPQSSVGPMIVGPASPQFAVNVNGLPSSPYGQTRVLAGSPGPQAVVHHPQMLVNGSGPPSSFGQPSPSSPSYGGHPTQSSAAVAQVGGQRYPSTQAYVNAPGRQQSEIVNRQSHQSDPTRRLAIPTGRSDDYGRLLPAHGTQHSSSSPRQQHHTGTARSPAPTAMSSLNSTTASTAAPAGQFRPSPLPSPALNSPRSSVSPAQALSPSVEPVIARKKPTSTMTAEDLYAIIHQSKKKMNIKTDLDRSISPTSSRSDSPSSQIHQNGVTSPVRPPLPRGYQVESGVLSPRSHSPQNVPGERRSWSGDRPASGSGPSSLTSPGDRRSWASDRLGPPRPTSMRDFKMLLLAASRGSPNRAEDGRRSAAELLKSPSPTTPTEESAPAATSLARTPTSMNTSSDSPIRRHQQNGSYHSPVSSSPVLPLNLSINSTPQRQQYPQQQQRPSPRINLFNSRLQAQHSRNVRSGSLRSGAVLQRTDVLSSPIMEDERSEDDDDDDDSSRPAWNYGTSKQQYVGTSC